MLYLNVPFEEKDEAKALYSKWDNNTKKWYATNPKYYYKFSKWIKGNLVFSNSVIIAEGKVKCWKCQNEISVYGFAVDSKNISDITYNKPVDISYLTGFDLQIWPISNENIPKKIQNILKDKFKCKIKYSKTMNKNYLGNTCPFCNSLQGKYFLHLEPDSPFGELGDSNLLLHKIKLKEDIVSYLSIDTYVDPPISFFKRSSLIETQYII